jgi:hypothetical protein
MVNVLCAVCSLMLVEVSGTGCNKQPMYTKTSDKGKNILKPYNFNIQGEAKRNCPTMNIPKTNTPNVDTPNIDTPNTSTPNTDTPNTGMPDPKATCLDNMRKQIKYIQIWGVPMSVKKK